MNTEQLKAVAMAATPGPRVLADHGDYGDYDGNCRVILNRSCAKRLAVVLGSDSAETAGTAQLMAEATPERILALLECVDALRDMLEQFTKTPSTLKDSQTRVKGHAALQKLEAL